MIMHPLDMQFLHNKINEIRSNNYSSIYTMSLDIGISYYALYRFLKNEKSTKTTLNKIEEFIKMWKNNDKTWYSEEEYNDLLAKYEMAVNQNNAVYKLYEQVKDENALLRNQLK